MSIFKFFIELLRLFIETNKTENIVFFKDELVLIKFHISLEFFDCLPSSFFSQNSFIKLQSDSFSKCFTKKFENKNVDIFIFMN